MKLPKISAQQYLAAYAGLLTLAFGVVVLSGERSSKKAAFDEITTQRINIVEPDGTLRLVVSDKARFPGAFIHGKEIPRPDRSGTGFLFINEEGTEMGGQMWDGEKKDGKISQNGHLSFDRYDGDEMLTIDTQEFEGKGATSLAIVDGNNDIAAGIAEAARIRALPADQQPPAWKKFHVDFPYTRRLILARDEDKSVILHMRDTQGRNRLILKVDPDGNPSIEFLDADGKVTSRLPSAMR